MPQITIDAAQSFMEAALGNIGLPASNATQVAEVILDSELRGHPDHGLFFCRMLIDMFQRANDKPDAERADREGFDTGDDRRW